MQSLLTNRDQPPLNKKMMMMNCFCGMADRRKTFSLFPVGTIVRDPHHLESPTRREQDFNLRRTWVQALLNEVVQ